MSSFVRDALERAAKTAAQTLLAFFGADALDVLNADWGQALSVSAGTVVLSLLSSVVSYNAGHSGTASLTTAVEPSP